MSNNSAKTIDGLFEKYSYKDALRLLGFDSIADLSEYLTGGNYDEGQARELCKDVLDEGNLDDIDPETEHGDEMRDRLAGKQVFLMNDAQKWLDQIITDMPYIEEGIYDDARQLKTYGKAKKYVRSFKHDFGGDFGGTPEEQMYSAFNTMLEDVVSKLNQDSNNAEIKK